MNILADSVSEVIGPRSLAYVAIKKAALDEDEGKARWAEMMFNQISVANRRRIRTTAIDKAYEEKQRARVQSSAPSALPIETRKDNKKSVEVADFRRLFGGGGALAGAGT